MGARMTTTRNWTIAAVAALAMAGGISGRAQVAGTNGAAAGGAPVMDATSVRATLDQYCVGCHSDRLKTGNLSLQGLDMASVPDEARVWEKVIQKLRAGTMPPGGSRRPDAAGYRALWTWLEDTIDARGAKEPNPGPSQAFHRLNRLEYQNAIRDLLALDVDVASLLPADDTYEHGFDNNADMLSMSPSLTSRYLLVAGRVSRTAVGVTPEDAAVATYRVHPNVFQDDRLNEDLPFGSRGGIAVDHYFPVDAEYTARVKLHRNFSDYIIGFSRPHVLEIRLDGALVKRFTVGDGDSKGRMAPLSFSGNIAGDAEWEYFMNTGDAGIEARFPATAGSHVVSVSFQRLTTEEDGPLQPRQRGYGMFVNEHYEALARVESVAVGGPYNVRGPGDTPSRHEIFVCRPSAAAEERACAERIIGRLARRAFRRAVTDADVAPLMAFYEEGRSEGTFDDGIQFALERILVDPEFLFRIEAGDEPGARPRTQTELASKLSFFLWSSIPDEPLLDSAIEGTLDDPEVLQGHVQRMLADERSRTLVDGFAAQWLRLRNLEDAARESSDFPDFDENLRRAFRMETELFVESTIREDRSVTDLLRARYTFVNERLARHYGIEGVYGPRFRRVALPEDSPRGGLLGQGSLLMVTSYPNRTSPVVRGKWLLESIVGAPPPEPPANVPGLPDRGEGGKPASVRERLENHRRNPVCAACHNSIDPMGFGLENFDAIGAWRDRSEAGTPIDATGIMPNGTKFEGPSGLRGLLLSQEREFAATVTSKLLSYALGRGLEYYDVPTVRAIVRDAARENYRWSAIVTGIARSVPFQMRKAGGEGVSSHDHQ